jgi:peptidoglycan lytic transglycosylase
MASPWPAPTLCRLGQLSVLMALLVGAPVKIGPASVETPGTPAPASATGAELSRTPPSTPETGRAPSTPHRPTAETGLASWYGSWHHGRRTASGEVFDMAKLTAAHRTLPLGSRVRVTNLANGRSVEVRVTDRGPAVPGRALDLSRAAAAKLEALEAGLVRVRIQLVSRPPRGGRTR